MRRGTRLRFLTITYLGYEAVPSLRSNTRITVVYTDSSIDVGLRLLLPMPRGEHQHSAHGRSDPAQLHIRYLFRNHNETYC